MKIRNKLFCLVSLISLLGGLSSCAGGDSSSSVSSSDTTSQDTSSLTDTSSTGETKRVKIEFWHTFGQGIVDILNRQISTFHDLMLENANVDVNIELVYKGSYDDIRNNILSGFAGGNVPSITVAYPDHVADYLYQEKTPGDYVVNLEPFMNSEEYGFATQEWLGDDLDNGGIDDFIPAFFDEGSSYANDGIYSLSFLKSTELMFYNKDLLSLVMKQYRPDIVGEDAMYQYISTISWDEFMDLNKFVAEHKSEIINTLEVSAYYDSDENLFISKMFQNEIPYASIDENGRGRIDFETGEARTAAENMVSSFKTAYENKWMYTKGTIGKYGSDYFTEQKCLFSIGSSGGTGYNYPQGDAFDVGVCPVPASNDNPLYVTQGPTLALLNNRKGANKEEQDLINTCAWEFMKYITNPDPSVEICVAGSEGYVPVRYSAYETSYFQTFLEEGEIFGEAANLVMNMDTSYLTTSAFPGSATLRAEMGGVVTQVMLGNKDVTTAFSDAINNAKLAM